MSEEQKPDTTEAVAKAIYEVDRPGRKWEHDYQQISQSTYRLLARAAIAAHNEELSRHPVKISLSELESAIAIARKREGKHTMDPASEVTMFFVDLGLPIEVIE